MCIQVYVYLRLRVYVDVLQCVAVCCSVLPCVAVRCRVLQCVAVHCSMLPCVAVCGSVLQVHVDVYSDICLFKAAGICV